MAFQIVNWTREKIKRYVWLGGFFKAGWRYLAAGILSEAKFVLIFFFAVFQ